MSELAVFKRIPLFVDLGQGIGKGLCFDRVRCPDLCNFRFWKGGQHGLDHRVCRGFGFERVVSFVPQVCNGRCTTIGNNRDRPAISGIGLQP